MVSVFIWIYAIIGVPLGMVADRWSRNKLMHIGPVVWTGMTALGGLAALFVSLLFVRTGVGVGEAV